MAAVFSELGELPPTVFTLSLQVLLHSALLSMSGFFHMASEQGLLKELLPTHITPAKDKTHVMGHVSCNWVVPKLSMLRLYNVI